jgi:uncharacterized protein (DUF2141 family)
VKAILISFFLISFSAAAASNQPEEQILEVIAQNGSVLSDPVIAFSDGQKVFLPVLDLAKVLGIRIEQTNPSQYAIYSDESNSLTLDASSCGSAFKQLWCDRIFEKKGIIYASDDYVRDTFKWPIEVSLKEMRVYVSTKATAQESYAQKEKKHKPLSIKREMLATPSSHVELGYTSEHNRGTVGIYAAQPLLNHDADLLYYNEATKEQLRFTMSKQLFDETNSLQPKSYAVFSAQTTEIKYLFSPTQINGFYVSNRRVDENIFDTHNIYEFGPPRWKVELYINGVYFGETIIDQDGRYSFLDVPLFYGNNRLIYRLTSPLGSVTEVTRSYDVGNEFAGDKKLSYIASFGQIENDSNYIGSAQMNYGISDHISAQVGYAQLPLADENKSYSLAGLNYLAPNYTIGLSKVTSTNSDEGYFSVIPKMNLGGILFSADHTEFNNFHSLLINKNLDQDQLSLTKVSALTQLNTAVPMTIQLQGEQDRFGASPTTREALLRMYTMFKGSSLLVETSKFWPSDYPPDLYVEVGQYLSFFRARYGVLTQNNRYGFSKIQIESNLPNEIFLNIIASAPTNISESTYTVGLSKLISEVQVETSFTGSQFDRVFSILLSSNFRSSSKGKSSSFTEGYRQGRIVLHAFVDENGNGKFDENEKPFSKLRVLQIERQKDYETDGSGFALIPAITPYQRVGLEVVRESITNIFLTAPEFTNDYVLTPGQELIIDVPISPSYDVSGILNNSYYKKLVPMELVSESGQVVAQATSTASGRYKFDDVRSGKYTIRVNSDFLAEGKIRTSPSSTSVEVSGKPGIRRSEEISISKIK